MPFALRVILCSVLLAAPLGAHPDLEMRIAEATALLRAAPRDAGLLVRRGRLYHQHREWERAIADFDAALASDPSMDAVHLMRSAALLGAARATEALAGADAYLGAHPGEGEGLVLRARALTALGRSAEAAADLGEAIDALRNPSIDLLVERARALASGAGLAPALESLDDALRRVGPVVSLRMEAVSLAREHAEFGIALARLDALIFDTPRPARLLHLRGQILAEAGKADVAIAAFDDALGEIDAMPARVRARPAFEQLRRSAARWIEGLRAGASPETLGAMDEPLELDTGAEATP